MKSFKKRIMTVSFSLGESTFEEGNNGVTLSNLRMSCKDREGRWQRPLASEIAPTSVAPKSIFWTTPMPFGHCNTKDTHDLAPG